MEQYRKVRLACRDGMSERAAARHPKLDGFTGLIDEWLLGDRKDEHRKHRHTAKRIFERLRDEHGFTGGYTIVKDHVREHHRRRREMYVPLVHPPGHAQGDFGEARAFIGGVKQKVHFFAFDLPHSDASYVRAYPAATAEAWVDGHVHAFSFFGTVRLSILYDNDRCLVSRIERDGTRRRTRLFIAAWKQPHGTERVFAIEPKESARLAGLIRIGIDDDESGQGSVGYGLDTDFQGCGYATEALEEVVRFGFEGLGIRRIWATVDTRNEKSWRVLERAGFRRETEKRMPGHQFIRGVRADPFLYAIRRDGRE